MTAKRNSSPANAAAPAPCVAEKTAIKAACEASNARPRRAAVKVENGGITSPHADHAGWTNHLADTFGSASDSFISAAINGLEFASRQRGARGLSDPAALNAALALVAAIDPANELEAAIAIQMAGTHALSMEMLGRAKQSDRTDHTQLYGGLAVKLQNTFAAQMVALAKLRGGGTQKVEVRHVHVNGNAVIGDGAQAVFGNATGGGENSENRNRPHTQGLEHLPGAPVPEVWGQDAAGDSVPIASGDGQAPLPDARG
jgi:hypothetical protein